MATEVYKNLAARERASKANKAWDPEELRANAGDTSRIVRAAIAKNSATPVDVLRNYYETDPSSTMVEALARNSSTPRDILAKLALDPRKLVWRNCFNNRSTPLTAAIEAARKTGDVVQAEYVCQLVMKSRGGLQQAFYFLLEDGWIVDEALFDTIPDDMLREYFKRWLSQASEVPVSN